MLYMHRISVNDHLQPPKSAPGVQSALDPPCQMALMMYPNDDQRSYVLTTMAYASSCLGFLASIFAICLMWLLPLFRPSMPDFHKGTAHHPYKRHSVSTAEMAPLPRPDRALPLPINTPPSPPGAHGMRLIAFNPMLSRIGESRGRRSVRPTPLYVEEYPAPASPSVSPEPNPSAQPPSSSLVSNEHRGHSLSRYDENHESDSSRHSSSRINSASLSTRFPIAKKVFAKHQRTSSAPMSSNLAQPNSQYKNFPFAQSPGNTPKSSRRFSTPWSLSRTNSSTSSISPTPSTSSDASSKRTPTHASFARCLSIPRSSSPSSLFRRKSDRRSSPKPVLRTQPYGAPYYAPTPIAASTAAWNDPRSSELLRSMDRKETRDPSKLSIDSIEGRSQSQARR